MSEPRVSDRTLATVCGVIGTFDGVRHLDDEDGFVKVLRACAFDLRDERAKIERLRQEAKSAKALPEWMTDEQRRAMRDLWDWQERSLKSNIVLGGGVVEAAKGKP